MRSVIAKHMHAFQRRALLQTILYTQVHVKEHKARKGQWMWVNVHAFIAFISRCNTHGIEFLSLHFLWLRWFPLLLVDWHQTDGKKWKQLLYGTLLYICLKDIYLLIWFDLNWITSIMGFELLCVFCACFFMQLVS